MYVVRKNVGGKYKHYVYNKGYDQFCNTAKLNGSSCKVYKFPPGVSPEKIKMDQAVSVVGISKGKLTVLKNKRA